MARGAYLAAAAGCDQCHTDSKQGAGPMPAVGRSRRRSEPANAQHHPRSGHRDRPMAARRFRPGNARWGVAPDTSQLSARLSRSRYYNRLSERDLGDLKAFSRSLPAVSQLNRPPTVLPLPLRAVRSSSSAWKCFLRTRAVPIRPRTRAVRIAAPTLLPRSAVAAIATRRAIGWVRPIPIALLAGVSAGRVACRFRTSPRTRKPGSAGGASTTSSTLLTDGQKPDFDFVGGAMGEIVNNTARLSDIDRRAIAVYLKSLPPIGSPKKD